MGQKQILLSVFLIANFSIVMGQWGIGLDTIKLSDLKSDNVPILTTKENLVKIFGEPSRITYNHEFYIYQYNEYRRVKDTVLIFNVLYYPNNAMAYIEKNGKIRLLNIDLKKIKKATITAPNFQLSRKLTLEQLKQSYPHYTNEYIAGSQIGLMSPYPMRKCRCFYQTGFSTGEHYGIEIELYFDCRKKLRYIEIKGYDF